MFTVQFTCVEVMPVDVEATWLLDATVDSAGARGWLSDAMPIVAITTTVTAKTMVLVPIAFLCVLGGPELSEGSVRHIPLSEHLGQISPCIVGSLRRAESSIRRIVVHRRPTLNHMRELSSFLPLRSRASE